MRVRDLPARPVFFDREVKSTCLEFRGQEPPAGMAAVARGRRTRVGAVRAEER